MLFVEFDYLISNNEQNPEVTSFDGAVANS